MNSSHHQAMRVPGDKLLVSAVSPQDGVIEAVELDTPGSLCCGGPVASRSGHTHGCASSRAIFAAFVQAAAAWQPPRVEESVSRT